MKNDLVTYFQLSMPNLTTTWNIFTKDVNTDKFECLIEILKAKNLTLITAHLQVKANSSTLGH